MCDEGGTHIFKWRGKYFPQLQRKETSRNKNVTDLSKGISEMIGL